MGGSIGRFFEISYVKFLFGGAVILSCVAGGIYLGDALVRKPSRVTGPVSLAPTLGMGDLFPLLTYTDSAGTSGSFEALLMGRRTLVLFLSSQCLRCEDMLDLWNRDITPILDSGVQVLVCFRESDFSPWLALLLGWKMIVIPEPRLYQLVGLKVTPTLIGLDEYGLVVYVQTGYTEVFGRDFYEHFAMTVR